MAAGIKPDFHPTDTRLRHVTSLLLRRTQRDVNPAHVRGPPISSSSRRKVVAGVFQPLVMLVPIGVGGRARVGIAYLPEALNEFLPRLIAVQPAKGLALLIGDDVGDVFL